MSQCTASFWMEVPRFCTQKGTKLFCSAALSPTSNPLLRSIILTVHSYLINESTLVILKSILRAKQKGVFSAGRQLQCLLIGKLSSLWLSCKLKYIPHGIFIFNKAHLKYTY